MFCWNGYKPDYRGWGFEGACVACEVQVEMDASAKSEHGHLRMSAIGIELQKWFLD